MLGLYVFSNRTQKKNQLDELDAEWDSIRRKRKADVAADVAAADNVDLGESP